MRLSLHDLWGCARGPVGSLAPPTRLLGGGAVFAACMVAPAATVPGSLLVGASALAWVAACRPPAKVVRRTVGLGLAMFLPYFLLVPWIPVAASERWQQAFLVPWTVLLHGLAGMLVSVSTVTATSEAELRDGLARLPVPGLVSAVLLQLVHQSAVLCDETGQMVSAMAVRGASSGWSTGLQVLFALPRVWLPRVLARAERVAAAMELRGYCEVSVPSSGREAAGLADGAVLALAASLLAGAMALRLVGAS